MNTSAKTCNRTVFDQVPASTEAGRVVFMKHSARRVLFSSSGRRPNWPGLRRQPSPTTGIPRQIENWVTQTQLVHVIGHRTRVDRATAFLLAVSCLSSVGTKTRRRPCVQSRRAPLGRTRQYNYRLSSSSSHPRPIATSYARRRDSAALSCDLRAGTSWYPLPSTGCYHRRHH